MKTLLIGDIHGCYSELLDLLEQASLSSDDRIIALGDIVDRGPDTPEVLEFFRIRPNTLSLMGNHERKHLRWSRGEVRPALSQQLTREQLGPAYPDALDFIAAFPLYLELPEALLVHGYLEPNVPLEEQQAAVLCGTMSGEHYLAEHYDQPWYELYSGDKPVVFAHLDILHNGQPFVYRDLLFGLDTSCVHGSRLTGLLLPEFRFVSVPSRADYWSQARKAMRAERASAKGKSNQLSAFAAPWDEASEQVLTILIAYAGKEHEHILAGMQADPTFAALSPRQQAKAYAGLVHGSPIERLLHLARRGELDAEKARQTLRMPEQARRLADELQLEHGEKSG